MAQQPLLFEIEDVGDVLVVTPSADLRELDYQQIEQAGRKVLQTLANNHARSVVMDFRQTDYYGSTALAFFLSVWRAVRSRGGHLAFCHVSEHEMQVLTLMRLDTLWSICDTREEALAAVQKD
jgi:anti-anti-sigma factor